MPTDFEFRTVWRVAGSCAEVAIIHTWKVNLAKRGLHRLAPLLKPIFAVNHRWAMRTGEQSLRLELRRRRACSDAERRRIPAPPRPTFRRRPARDDPWPASDIELQSPTREFARERCLEASAQGAHRSLETGHHTNF